MMSWSRGSPPKAYEISNFDRGSMAWKWIAAYRVLNFRVFAVSCTAGTLNSMVACC